MPQLDPQFFAPQLIWLVITFTLLYLLMAKVALPRVGKVLEDRRGRIEGDLDSARRMKAEAETVIAAYERSLAEARAEAQAQLRAITDKLAAEAAERQRQVSAHLVEEVANAERRIAAARASALANLRGVAIEVARDAAVKLIGVEPDEARAGAAVDAVLKERA